MSQPVIAVVGMTATGKSALALDLADALGGAAAAEVVNADAMQLYRGMDVGTAKVPPAERRGVVHHQLDVLDPWQEARVAAYQRAARADLAAIERRGRRPLLVGGSGLYVRSVLDHLEFPGTDPVVRAELEQRMEQDGARSLHDELGALDPAAAERIDPRNARRVIRALEVIAITGEPFSARLPGHDYAVPAVQLAVAVPRAELDERIARRAAAMLSGGLLEETAALLAAGMSATAARAVGYAQAADVLAGRRTREEAVADVAAATRRLARRQQTWFRRDPRITWLDGTRPEHLVGEALRTLDA